MAWVARGIDEVQRRGNASGAGGARQWEEGRHVCMCACVGVGVCVCVCVRVEGSMRGRKALGVHGAGRVRARLHTARQSGLLNLIVRRSRQEGKCALPPTPASSSLPCVQGTHPQVIEQAHEGRLLDELRGRGGEGGQLSEWRAQGRRAAWQNAAERALREARG